jgi:hypothetical protein
MSVYMELVTDVQLLRRRSFDVANRALVSPSNANPFVEGEFVNLDSAYKLIRGASNSFGYMVWDEKGRYDVQALGKLTVLHGGGGYEADTRVFTSAGLTLGGPLGISAAVSIDTVTKSGLYNWVSGPVIGYVTRLPANNGQRLRFHETLV